MNGIDSLQSQNAELKDRLHMFESLIDQALDAVIISDLLGKLQYVNTAMAQIAGYPDPATMLAQTSSNAGFFSTFATLQGAITYALRRNARAG